MKTLSILKQFMILGALILFVTSCEKNEIDEIEQTDSSVQQKVNETPTEDAIFPTEVSETSIEVAKIQKNGHEYRFVAVGENDDIVVIEKLYGLAEKNFEDSSLEGDLSPFEIFVSLTDANIQVPERIAKASDEAIVKNSKRKISKSFSSVEILDSNYSETSNRMACTDIGATGFRNSYCGGTPVTSSPSDIRFCDNGTWTSNTRNSYFGGWKELDDTFTWTNVICGLTRVQFYAYESSGIWPFNSYSWKLKYQADFTNGIWYARYYTSSNTERQVKRTRPNNTGSFRAYTRFF